MNTNDKRSTACIGTVEDTQDSAKSNLSEKTLQSGFAFDYGEGEMSEVIRAVSAYIEEQYCALYHIWVENNTYVCLQEKMEGVLSAIGEKGDYDSASEVFIRNFIDPADWDRTREFANLGTLVEKLKDCNSISYIYRRKKSGWTRGTFFAGRRDEKGNVTNIIHAVTDINAEIENKRKHEKSVYEAEHDALTDVYNRKGFENIVLSDKMESCRIGLAFIDIDNFKSINDTFGHAVGDQVLRAVAGLLASNVYPNDVVARVGGDEFAIMFYDCDVDAWDNICLKISAVHKSLASLFFEIRELSVTLSCGLCFSDNGYEKIMYQLSDEALYETKKRGRAGCTLINREHKILKYWQDERLSLFTKNVLAHNNTGIGQIEIPLEGDLPCRFICGDNTRLIFGMPRTASAEECYRIFKKGIDPYYRDILLRAEQSMLETGQTECTFLWCHPDFGEISIRCEGIGEKKDDRIVLLGYFHTLKDTNIVDNQSTQTHINNALKNYDRHLHSMSEVTENTLCMYIINLTYNTYETLECRDSIRHLMDKSPKLDALLLNVSSYIVDRKSRNAFQNLFSREYLLQQSATGNTPVQMECIFKVDEKHYEWITCSVDMAHNPVTGEITGVAYMTSMQNEKMNQLLLQKTLEQDYLFAATVFADTDEFYLYNSKRGKFSECMQNYWDVALRNAETYCSKETFEDLKGSLAKEKIFEYLSSSPEYRFAFDCVLNQKKMRLEIRFSYLDESHTMLLASVRNITDLSLLSEYRHSSEHDSLTGLYNRETLFQKCRMLLDTYPEDRFVMVHIDIRHFQLYNTFFGDEAGDRLLCYLADMLRRLDDDYDYWAYGRIEADVFAAFLPYDDKLYHAHVSEILQDIKNLRSEFQVEPKLGLYFVADLSMSIESMFARATVAAKSVQHDTPYATVIFDDKMEKRLTDNQQITNEMQNAADSEQFQVYLQPKYSLRTGKAVGAEALVRWMHPERGIITPNRFIPLFESNGFIATLDRYMWEHTCRILHRWKKEGRKMMPISVNVSRISIYSQGTVDFLKNLVRKYDLEPRYLELELTESAYVESPEEIRPRLEELKTCGFTILMDDFGSGYSSLNTLENLPVDILKLDMKFLKSSKDSERSNLIIVSIIRMSKLLNISVIAEGVEYKKQADYLCSIGCEYAQGFLYERPIPVSDFEEKILAQNSYTEEVMDTCTESVSGLLGSTMDTSEFFGGLLPDPLMTIEYCEGYFALLRANDALMSELGLNSDLRPAHLLFEEHLSDSDYDRMMRAYAMCAETKTPLSFRMIWNDGEDHTRYLVRVSYNGNIGVEHMMTVILTDETPKNYLE